MSQPPAVLYVKVLTSGGSSPRAQREAKRVAAPAVMVFRNSCRFIRSSCRVMSRPSSILPAHVAFAQKLTPRHRKSEAIRPAQPRPRAVSSTGELLTKGQILQGDISEVGG